MPRSGHCQKPGLPSLGDYGRRHATMTGGGSSLNLADDGKTSRADPSSQAPNLVCSLKRGERRHAAGRIFRRQQAESGAAAGLDAVDVALKLAARIGIDCDRDRLARAHVIELGFQSSHTDTNQESSCP
jgi:hypothetical protein